MISPGLHRRSRSDRRRAGRISRALAALVLVGGCSAADPARPNIVLVTIDTLRADHVHALGYPRPTTPNLDALAAEGALFTQAISPAPETAPAHASMLTGLHPPAHAVRSNGIAALPAELTTIAELTAGAGYRTGAFVGSFVLARKFGLDQGFETYDDEMGSGGTEPRVWYGNVVEESFDRPAGPVTDAALAWLDDVRGEPFFLWVHYYDPHTPYEPPAEHDLFPRQDPASTWAAWEAYVSRLMQGEIDRQDPAVRARTRTLLRDMVSLYDGEIHYADAQLGRLLASLDERGLRDETLVIVTSDHGESLVEDGYFFRHGWHLYDNVLRVPLVIRFPGRLQAGAVVDAQVELVDLFRVMVSAVPEIEPPAATWPLRDLLALSATGARGEREYAYAETFLRRQLRGQPPLFALRSPRWKYVDNLRDPPQRVRALYDLTADPRERSDQAEQQGELVERLRERLRSFLEANQNAELAAKSRLEPDDTTLERLRALGYIR